MRKRCGKDERGIHLIKDITGNGVEEKEHKLYQRLVVLHLTAKEKEEHLLQRNINLFFGKF